MALTEKNKWIPDCWFSLEGMRWKLVRLCVLYSVETQRGIQNYKYGPNVKKKHYTVFTSRTETVHLRSLTLKSLNLFHPFSFGSILTIVSTDLKCAARMWRGPKNKAVLFCAWYIYTWRLCDTEDVISAKRPVLRATDLDKIMV